MHGETEKFNYDCIVASKMLFCVIQGDSRGKVNIVFGDSIGYCEKRSSYEPV